MKKSVKKTKKLTPKDVIRQSHPEGRPSKYNPEYCQKIIDFMKDGKSLSQFAGEISVHVDTVYQWAKDFSEFSDAMQVAKQKCEQYWETKGQECFTNRRLNADWWKFYMKARFRWTEPQEIKQDTTNLNVEATKDNVEQLARQLEEAAMNRAKFG